MGAGRYTHGHHESVLRSHRWRNVENSAGYLLPYLRPGAEVLDVGCGPGTITVDLARRNGGYPDGGRLLKSWAMRAGFAEVRCSASVWCFATADERAWWGGMWADRVRESAFASRAVELGLATRDDLDGLAAAWRDWTADDEAWFSVLNGEILCSP